MLSHLQELLNWVKVCSSKKYHSRVPLSINRWTKTVLIVLPWSKVKEIQEELHGGFLGRHLGANHPWTRLDSSTTGCTQADIERWCQQEDSRAARQSHWTQSHVLIHLHNGAQYKKITENIAQHFERASRICRYLLIAEECFSWPEVCTSHNQEVSTGVDIFVTDFLSHIRIPRKSQCYQ